jgi:hypothetical protein
MTSRFPDRVYTAEEVDKARRYAESGLKHRLASKGGSSFKRGLRDALRHVKTAGFHDFLRTYIRQVAEIDGFSQLREDEAAIWINMQLLANPIETAGFLVQKAYLMKEFLEGRLHYGGVAEAKSVEKRVEFLKALEGNSKNRAVKEECARMLKSWAESTFVF